jgi:ParB-like chromosome segregation protein Spo0J
VPSKYTIHPAANIFPMLSDDDFAALKQDIETNGQLDDIAFFEEMVIDGRNRLRACEELGIEPQWYELTECKDPVAYVLSKNLHRRHLTPSQRAQCAEAVATLREGRPSNETMQTCTVSMEQAADAFSVSRRSVATARHVADKGDKATVEAVKSGEITVSAAAKLVDAVPDKKEQRKIVKEGKKAVAAKIKENKPKAKRRSKKDADGGAVRVTDGQLAGMEPDPVGVSSGELNRVGYWLEKFQEDWDQYTTYYGDNAEWMYASTAWEQFKELAGYE